MTAPPRPGASSRRRTRRSVSRSPGSASRGPEEELKLTANTQPAILTHSIAAWADLRQRFPGAARGGGVRGRPLARRVLGPGRLRVAGVRDRGCARARARTLHAGGRAARRRGDGRDRGACRRGGRSGLPGGRARRVCFAGQLQLAGADRHRRVTRPRWRGRPRGASRAAPNARFRSRCPLRSTAR